MTIKHTDLSTGCDFAEAVSKRLETDIKSQELADGTKLMPVRQLASKYKTSYLTMRKAINLLSNKGLLSSRQGSGVYVTISDKRTQQQQKISVVFCGFEAYVASAHFYTSLLCGVEREAAGGNAEIAAFFLGDIKEFVSRDIYSDTDGFLLVGTDVPGLADALKGKPVVWMMGGSKAWGDHISYDNRLAGVFAAEELIAAGRKNLMCINIHPEMGDERCRAFKEHAESLGAKVSYINNPEALVMTRREQHIDFNALSSWVDRIENELPGLNGVFVVDMVAHPLYTMLVDRGIKPGKDIEIATANWRDFTTGGTQYQPVNVILHPEEVGAVAMRQLRWRINNPQAKRIVMRIEPEVEQRS